MEYEKFERLLEQNKTSVYRVSKATGIACSTFSDWKSGRSSPKADKLSKIADYFGVGLDEMLGTDSGKRSDMKGYLHVRAKRMVPIIGEIRAGSPIITDETLLGYEFADLEGDEIEDYFYLKVCGDSMKNCGIVDGSLVLFHKQQYAENGQIVACLVGGDSATIKRFRRERRHIYLEPENEDYRPIELTPEDFETGEARILGVAREVKIRL